MRGSLGQQLALLLSRPLVRVLGDSVHDAANEVQRLADHEVQRGGNAAKNEHSYLNTKSLKRESSY